MNGNPLQKIRDLGQRIWLDYIQRDLLDSGAIAALIDNDGLAGITANPTIFARAIAESQDYDNQIAMLKQRGLSAQEIYETLALDDLRAAADLLEPQYRSSDRRDGYACLEVSPHLADDTQATVAEARRLWRAFDRPNAMIKVPGTPAGLPAITELLAEGINVNVTLLFGVPRYGEVVAAFLEGLERRLTNGGNVAGVASVASFFLSRIDTLVDKRLDAISEDRDSDGKSLLTTALRGRAAVACAQLAYQDFLQWTGEPRWRRLLDRGAMPQRLLWASTGSKDPAYSKIKYVEELVAANTVNTMPPATLDAYRELGQPALSIENNLQQSRALPDELSQLGIELEAVAEQLEREGVQQFVESHDRLLAYIDKH